MNCQGLFDSLRWLVQNSYTQFLVLWYKCNNFRKYDEVVTDMLQLDRLEELMEVCVMLRGVV